jgi:acyl dehydratase
MTASSVDAAGFEAGRIVLGRVLKMTLARVLAFSGGALDEPGWPLRNIHTDLDTARQAGLDSIIASGTQSEGLLIGLLVDVFGDAWAGHGELELAFRKPVRVGDTVRPGLQWTHLTDTPAGARWVASVWCETAAGERVIEGTASCIAPGKAVR